jgi:hypothetical protein
MPNDPRDIPAFPQTATSFSIKGCEGMTLRDYFAIHASHDEIDCMFIDDLVWCAKLIGIKEQDYNGRNIKASYEIADAIISHEKELFETVKND